MAPDDIGLPGLHAEPSGLESAPERPGWRPSEGTLLALWALLTAALVVFVLHGEESDALHDPVKQAARGEITGLAPLSLLNAAQTARAIQALEKREPHGRVISFRVQATRIDADLRVPGFKDVNYQVDNALQVHRFSEDETTHRALALDKLDPAIPQRLVEQVNALSGTTPDDVDYLNLAVYDEQPLRGGWLIHLARGTRPDQRDYSADLDGSNLKRNGS